MNRIVYFIGIARIYYNSRMKAIMFIKKNIKYFVVLSARN